MLLSTGLHNVFGGITVDQLLELLRELDYCAECHDTTTAEPIVRIRMSDDLSCFVRLVFTDGERPNHATAIQFLCFADDVRVTPEQANRCNLDLHLLRVVSDKDGHFGCIYDVALGGGVTRQFVIERIGEWRQLLYSAIDYLVAAPQQ